MTKATSQEWQHFISIVVVNNKVRRLYSAQCAYRMNLELFDYIYDGFDARTESPDKLTLLIGKDWLSLSDSRRPRTEPFKLQCHVALIFNTPMLFSFSAHIEQRVLIIKKPVD